MRMYVRTVHAYYVYLRLTHTQYVYGCTCTNSITFFAYSQAPQRLIVQLPRYGKEFKVYERLYPELHIDVSDICADYSEYTCIHTYVYVVCMLVLQ